MCASGDGNDASPGPTSEWRSHLRHCRLFKEGVVCPTLSNFSKERLTVAVQIIARSNSKQQIHGGTFWACCFSVAYIFVYSCLVCLPCNAILAFAFALLSLLSQCPTWFCFFCVASTTTPTAATQAYTLVKQTSTSMAGQMGHWLVSRLVVGLAPVSLLHNW